MSFVDHARRELQISGQLDDDPAYAQALLATVAVFESHQVLTDRRGRPVDRMVEQLTTLLRNGTLTPLTNCPTEWARCPADEWEGEQMWQSLRNPSAFSTDGGTTFWLMEEDLAARQAAAEATPRPVHVAVPGWSGRNIPDPGPGVANGCAVAVESPDQTRTRVRVRQEVPR